MNRRDAIRECKKLWGEIEASGLSKWAFLNAVGGQKWDAKEYSADCPLCHYSGVDCEGKCPLFLQLGDGCYELGFNDFDPCPDFWEAVRKLKIK